MINVAVLGAGQIGQAVVHILHTAKKDKTRTKLREVDIFHFDKSFRGMGYLDVADLGVLGVAGILKANKIEYVINALPFYLNAQLAQAARLANCHYLDFTEDDAMSDTVRSLYVGSNLFCATKCGLAPGFINYLGYDIVQRIDQPESLLISVGALPRHYSAGANEPWKNYSISWSVDGLVNEYLKPCQVKVGGGLCKTSALEGRQDIVIDGVVYEAAHTSGGVGDLLDLLPDVSNICYKTMRYPGHYNFIDKIISTLDYDYDKIVAFFLKTFPRNVGEDVITVYAEADGKSHEGQAQRAAYGFRFGATNVNGKYLSAIQSTTAAGGVAILELALNDYPSGVLLHNVPFDDFKSSYAFQYFYNRIS